MVANKEPIFTISGDPSNNDATGMNQLVLNGSTDYTGIDADTSLIFTANATSGAFIREIKAKAGGTNTASVARIYLNNGSAPTTATNNTFWGEMTLPATTAIATAATAEPTYPMNIALPPGFRIYVALATAVAAGWVFNAVAGQYE